MKHLIEAGVFGATLVVAGTAVADIPAPSVRPSVRSLGHTLAEYRDNQVQLVASWRWAEAHPHSKWIFLDTWVSPTSNGSFDINREGISLVTPDGSRIDLASQRRLAENLPNLKMVLLQARVFHDPIAPYFPGVHRLERFKFFTVPGRHVVFDSVGLGPMTLAHGDLFFESPTGSFAPGVYTLVIRNRNVNVRLPFTLG